MPTRRSAAERELESASRYLEVTSRAAKKARAELAETLVSLADDLTLSESFSVDYAAEVIGRTLALMATEDDFKAELAAYIVTQKDHRAASERFLRAVSDKQWEVGEKNPGGRDDASYVVEE